MKEQAKTRFGVLGVAGYIAPRHLEAVRATGNEVVLACDPSDSVGILDRYGLTTEFTTDEVGFAEALERRAARGEPVQFVAICTPNHLHFSHCRRVLAAGSSAICEKPLALASAELDALAELERRTGQRVYTVLQLRVHDRLVDLRQKLARSGSGKHDVRLTYVVGRGPWYQASWKGDRAKSGGVATNIGIHLFDLLLWLFGAVEHEKVHLADASRMAGFMELERARVRWFVSVDPADAAGLVTEPGRATHREIVVDGEPCEFSDGFAELHGRVYQAILDGRGLGIEEARPSVELTERLRHAPVEPLDAEAHPLVVRFRR